ncbi:MAG: hypothetical protein IT317_00820 [Anaerolineales bacterium]|nr:hypothetical protein [Anaerolineales bacterium]
MTLAKPPTLLRALLGLHRLGLRLYPRRFRAEFEAEMQAVFAEALAEAAALGLGAVTRVLAREWASAPGQIVGEHWRAAHSDQPAGGAVHTETGMATRTLTRGFAATVVTLLVAAPVIFWLWWLFGRGVNGGALLPGLLCLAVLAGGWAWALSPAVRRLGAGPWLAAGVACLAGLLWPTAGLVEHPVEEWPGGVGLMILLLPALALVVGAVLVAVGVETWPAGDAPLRRQTPAALALAALLTLKVFGNLYWLLVWDLTYDPLGWLWLMPVALAAVLGGALLVFGLPGRKKWAGLYGVALLAGLFWLAGRAQAVDFRALTATRAAQIAPAIETFHSRWGRYPTTLKELGWWYRLTRPTPVIIAGQDWCYQGRGDAYALGYVDRAHWSSPDLIVRRVAARGQVAGEPPLCAAEIEALGQPRPAELDTGDWSWAGTGWLEDIQPGLTRAQVLQRAVEVWHRDTCVPERAPNEAYAYLDLLWTGANNVRQATVVAVRYTWGTGSGQWVVEQVERVPQADLYARYARCSSLDLTPLAEAAPEPRRPRAQT